MTYSTELNKISRRKIDLLILKMDYCTLTFGVLPCTASGTPCYNTYPTCTDGYVKGSKDYKFINEGLPLSVVDDYYGAKPYIKDFNDLPTEIKEMDTVVKRLKINLYDEEDNDVGIDPYRDQRTNITGTFWKKFLTRNRNYKGRILELYEGFEGMLEADFQLKFAGSIDNIELGKGTVTIEAVDLLKKLSEVEYPLNQGISLNGAIGNYYEAFNSSQMTAIADAEVNDICRRKDFKSFTVTATPATGGSLALDTYYYKVIAYDTDDKPFAAGEVSITLAGLEDEVDLSWSALTGASYYRAWGRTSSYEQYWQVTTPFTTDDGTAGITATIPAEAYWFRKLTIADPTTDANWAEIHNLTTVVDDASELDASGYIKIGKEIIYYASITTNTLNNIGRAQLETEADRYSDGTIVYSLIYKSPDNPFTHLKSLLSMGGIDAAYIDAKFTTYETAWSGINFSTRVITKETKLSKIYFQLVNAVDCMSWVGEDGKIKILKHTENPATYATLTDDANIIYNSAKVDLNEKSRYTRWLLYWNHFDLEKSIEDNEAFNRGNLTVDATAESADEYNDKIEHKQYCTFLNDDSDVVADINTWIDSTLLANRLTRMRDAQEIITCDVELKDNDIVTGEVIKLSTSQLQDKDGVNYNTVQFRLIKKEPKGNKISFKLIRRFT